MMRERITTLLIGFVAGIVSMYLFLWGTGVLNPYLARVKAQTVALPAAQGPRPELNPSTPTMLPAPPEANFSDARVVPPIAGLRLADVQDTFNQPRPNEGRHEAVDIMAARGTPVRAMVDGVIRKLFFSKPGGNTVYEFDPDGVLCYYYAHLDRYADGIAEGQHVTRGDVIGFVGTTGNANANAPHLHLAIFRLGPEKRWWEGTAIDPYPILKDLLGTAR